MKRSSTHLPLTAWIVRSLDWNFQDPESPAATELGQHPVKSIRAHRTNLLNESKGEILLVLENYPDSEKYPKLIKNLSRLMSERKRIIEKAAVLRNGSLLFTFKCASFERLDYFAKDMANFFNYKRDESQCLFEMMDAVKEVFEMLGIDQKYLQEFKLNESTLVIKDDGAWIDLERFLKMTKGLQV